MFPYEKVDYTLLKATATQEEIYNLCCSAIANNCASVCIPPSWIEFARELFPSLTICTVVGFPLGNTSIAGKVAEIHQAIEDGADEIDFVVNVGMVKSSNWGYVHREIDTIRKASEDKIIKMIFETCYLTEIEILRLCRLADKYNIDFVKTSTGFGTEGASARNVQLMKQYCTHAKVKASGGIRTTEEAYKFLALGTDRLGMSKLP